jgi:hypothetical protein
MSIIDEIDRRQNLPFQFALAFAFLVALAAAVLSALPVPA